MSEIKVLNVPKTLKELKKLILTSKKDNTEQSKSYASILKQLEAATIGVKNAETNEEKIILSAAKKELKEQEQSKSLNAPFNEVTIEICSAVVKELSPTAVSEEETVNTINSAIAHIEKFGFNPDMKQIMSFVKSDGRLFDMKLVSQIANKLLKAK